MVYYGLIITYCRGSKDDAYLKSHRHVYQKSFKKCVSYCEFMCTEYVKIVCIKHAERSEARNFFYLSNDGNLVYCQINSKNFGKKLLLKFHILCWPYSLVNIPFDKYNYHSASITKAGLNNKKNGTPLWKKEEKMTKYMLVFMVQNHIDKCKKLLPSIASLKKKIQMLND